MDASATFKVSFIIIIIYLFILQLQNVKYLQIVHIIKMYNFLFINEDPLTLLPYLKIHNLNRI